MIWVQESLGSLIKDDGDRGFFYFAFVREKRPLPSVETQCVEHAREYER